MSQTTKKIAIAIFLLLLSVAVLMRLEFPGEKPTESKPYYHDFAHLPFSNEGSLEGWSERVLRGHVQYEVRDFANERCIYALSDNAASAMFYKVRIEMERRPVLSWRWNAIRFPEKKLDEDLADPQEDDYVARLYVVFPAFFITGMKAMEYVWAESVPKGSISSSPYSPSLKLVVLQSGRNEKGNWIYEERDLYHDYVEAFGEEPDSDPCAIAIMTDADSTETVAEAAYDDIRIQYKNKNEPHRKGE